MTSISTSEIAKLLVAISNEIESLSIPTRHLLVEAANRLLSQKSEIISLYRKMVEVEAITYRDVDHGNEI